MTAPKIPSEKAPATRVSPLPDPSADAPQPFTASLVFLSFNPATLIVTARLEPSSDALPATLERLRAQLASEGFADFYTSDEILHAVVSAANRAVAGELPIAERRDAKLELTISNDKKALHASLVKAYGGKPLTMENLKQALKDLRVPARCVLQQALVNLIAAGEGQQALVAQAIAPQKGDDARFDVLIDACRRLDLQPNAQGRIDFFESHEFVVVEPGAPLMRRKSPTQGKPGIDVQGNLLKPEPGKQLAFNRDIEGAEVSPGDPDLLVAAIKGHPVVIPAGVRVDPTLHLKNVNLATGNVAFDGSIDIAGDVASGLRVQATGDVFIRGMVEKADVSAHRNLIINGGVMGDDLGRDRDNQLILHTRLRAGGTISAKFISLTEVIAGQDIVVREYVMQSYLRAQGAILIGQQGGKGSLIGGRTHAASRVVANILGSDAYVFTEVRVGKENNKRRSLEKLKQAYKQSERTVEQLLQLLDSTAPGLTEEKLARLELTLSAQHERQSRIRALIERLRARQRTAAVPCIDIKQALHANVALTINHLTHLNESDVGPRCLVRAGVELVAKR